MFISALVALSLTMPQSGPGTVLADVGVVDAERGVVLPHRSVLVRAGVIAAVGDAAAFDVPDGVTVIEGRGRYLVPGLIDTHVHVHEPEDASLLLAFGVTTARILDGGRADLRLAAASEGDPTRARLRVCRQVDGVGDARDAARVVADAKRDGYACLKLYSPPPWTIEAYRALANEAARAGLPLEGHLPRNLALTELLAGPHQGSVAHLEELLYAHFFRAEHRATGGLDTAEIEPVATLLGSEGVQIGSTLRNYRTVGWVASAGFDTLASMEEMRYVPPRTRRRWADEDNVFRRRVDEAASGRLLTTIHPFLARVARAIVERGGTLVLGTDASWNLPYMIPGPAVHGEIEELLQAGLTPAQVVRAATVDAAALLGESRLGRLAPGMLADALLVEGDPLEDPSTLRRPVGILRGGAWLPREELDAILKDIARRRR